MSVDFSALGGVVKCMAEKDPLVVRRPEPQEMVNGRSRPPSYTPLLDICGSTWPVQGRRLDKLTEGKHDHEILEVFTTPGSAALVASNRVAQIDGDIITVDGTDFEVIQVHRYSRGEFTSYLAQEIKRTAGV